MPWTDAAGRTFINEYNFVRQLGAGQFGALNLCGHFQSGALYAIREVARPVITRRDLYSAGLRLKNLRHPPSPALPRLRHTHLMRQSPSPMGRGAIAGSAVVAHYSTF